MCGGEKTLHVLAYGVECVGYNTLELVSKIVGIKLLDIHDGGIIFLGEPGATLALLISPYVARIAARSFPADAIVLPQTVFKKLLR